MEAAKAAVSKFTSKVGHTTDVDEVVNPAITREVIKPHRHEETTEAIDREVHQHHYHTTVQPVTHQEILPEKHAHQMMPTEKREFHHGDHDAVKRGVSAEIGRFADTSTTHETQHTRAAAPTVSGEHVHHHVHETVQPVIHKETVQPEVVHTTIPIHEVHHAEATHHTMSALPMKTLDEFTKAGGILHGGDRHTHEEYEGAPRPYNKGLQTTAEKVLGAVTGHHHTSGTTGTTAGHTGLTGHHSGGLTDRTSTGSTGLTGTTGHTGLTGHHSGGLTDRTSTGSTGLMGTTGTTGTSGLTGHHNGGLTDRTSTGSTGLMGTSGTTGSTGLTGHHNNGGLVDRTSTTGRTGGVLGGTGSSGLTGTSGTSGYDNPQSTTAGPHSSNLLNKADPRVDSDRDHRNDPTSRVGGYGTQGTSGGLTGTSGTTGTTGGLTGTGGLTDKLTGRNSRDLNDRDRTYESRV